MSYAEKKAAKRRLTILELLIQDRGHANESVLEQGLLERGERVGLDRTVVRGLCRDLETRECVKVEMLRDTLMVVAITRRGVAAAEGRITVEGVAEPELGI